MAKISASFAIYAGGWAEGELEVEGLTPDEVAELIQRELDPEVSVCHQCAHRISDPEAEEVTGFSVDGVYYEKRGDHWREAAPDLDPVREMAPRPLTDEQACDVAVASGWVEDTPEARAAYLAGGDDRPDGG